MTDELREPTFLLLTALAGGRQHGYALVQDVLSLSDGRVHLRAGTLYGALDRLVSQDLVSPAGDEVVDGRLRRYYDLTQPGIALLAEQTARRRSSVRAATTRLRALGVTA
jgi:DNA-binding PadR family transcriptional regulator